MKLIKYILIFLLVFSITVSDDKGGYIEGVSNDNVQIDFEKNEFYAEGGIRFIYDNAKVEAHRIKKDEDKNILTAYDEVLFNQEGNTAEAERIVLNLDDKTAEMFEGKSETDEVYYGGEYLKAEYPDKVEVDNAYFTTCDHVVKDDEDTHYIGKAKKVVIYPGKKLVAKNTVFYIGKMPILWVPYYVTSLKKGKEQAPLFPRFGYNEEEGVYVIWGFDYGVENDNYDGFLTLNLSEKKGLTIDKWKTYYYIDKNKNEGELELSEVYFPSQNAKDKWGHEQQWKSKWEHNYKKNNNTFKSEIKYETTNTINELNDDNVEKKSSATETELLRAQVKSDMKKLGPKEDMSLFVDLFYTNDNTAIKKLAEAATDDTDAEKDTEIKTEIKFEKRPGTIMPGTKLYYKHLEDLDPGQSDKDTMSRQDKQEYDFDIKKIKTKLHYMIDEKDVWRKLRESEKTADEDNETVPKYDKDNKEEYSVDMGSYTLLDTKFKVNGKYDNNIEEKKLNRDLNSEGEEYNSDELLNEEKSKESYNFNLSHTSRKLGFGYEKEKNLKDYRDDEDDLDEQSENYVLKVSDSKIDLKQAGKLNALYEYKKRVFVKKDIRDDHYYKLVHDKDIINNKNNPDRVADLRLTNKAEYSHKFYEYDIADREYKDEEEKEEFKKDRLKSTDIEKNYKDSITLDLGNTSTKYNFSLSEKYDGYKEYDYKKSQVYKNNIDFTLDNQKIIDVGFVNSKNFDEDKDPTKISDSTSFGLSNDESKIGFTSKDSESITYSGEDENKYQSKNSTNIDKKYEYKVNNNLTLKYSTGEKITKSKSSLEAVSEKTENTVNNIYQVIFSKKEDEINRKVDIYYKDYEDRIKKDKSLSEYKLKFQYVDKSEEKDEEDEETSLAEELEDEIFELTKEEQEEVEQLLAKEKEKTVDVDLMRLGEDSEEEETVNTKSITLNVDLKSQSEFLDEKGFSKDNFDKSLTSIELDSKIVYNRFSTDYKFQRVRDGADGEITKKEHINSSKISFGNNHYRYRLGYDLTYDDELTEDNEKKLKNWGITFGHDIHCTSFDFSYNKDWDANEEEYKTVWEFKFWIIAFPEKKLKLITDEEDDKKIYPEIGI